MGTDFSNIGTDFSKLGTDFSAIGTDFRGKGTSFASTEQMYLSQEETLDGHTSAWKEGRMEITKLYGNTDDQARGVGNEVVQNWDARYGARHNSGTEVDVTLADNEITIVVPEGGITTTSTVYIGNILPIVGRKCLVYGGLSSDVYLSVGGGRDEGQGFVVTPSTNAYAYIYLRVGTPSGVYKIRPQIVSITGTPYEDVTSADEFAQRLGFADASKLPAFPFGSSYSACIKTTDKDYPFIFHAPLNKIGDLRDWADTKGNEYHALGVVDLGTLSFIADHGDSRFYTTGLSSIILKSTQARAYCSKFEKGSYVREGCFYISAAGNISFNHAGYESASAADFKAAMQGVLLVYELAEPTTTKAIAWSKPSFPVTLDTLVTVDSEVKPSMDVRYYAKDTVEEFEGSPMDVLAIKEKKAKSWEVFGNTDSNAKGVGTVVEQMVKNGDFANGNYWKVWGYAKSLFENNEASVILTRTAESNYDGYIGPQQSISLDTTHKYLTNLQALTSKDGSFRIDTNGAFATVTKPINKNTWTNLSCIGSALKGALPLALYPMEKTDGYLAGDYYKIRNVQLFDLTSIFGAGNEPATADEFANRLGYASAEDLPYFPNSITMGKVDMGTLEWIYQPSQKRFYSETSGDIKTPANDNTVAAIDIKGYTKVAVNSIILSDSRDLLIGVSTNKRVYIRNLGCTSSAEIKAALSGVILEYELATPIPTSTTVMPIKVGSRNLAYVNIPSSTKTENGITWRNEGDHLFATGTATGYTDFLTGMPQIPFTEDLYVSRIGIWENATATINFYRADGSSLTYISINVPTYQLIKSNYPDAAYIKWGLKRNNNVKTELDGYLCIAQGSYLDKYTPYFPPRLFPNLLSAPLHKVGDVADTVDSNGKEWHRLTRVNLKDATFGKYGTTLVIIYPLSGPAKKINSQLVHNLPYGVDWANRTQPNITLEARIGTWGVSSQDELIALLRSLFASGEYSIVYELAEPTESTATVSKVTVPAGESQISTETDIQPSNIKAKI